MEVSVFALLPKHAPAPVGGWYPEIMGFTVAALQRGKEVRLFAESDLPALVQELKAAPLVVGCGLANFAFRVLCAYPEGDLNGVRYWDVMEQFKKHPHVGMLEQLEVLNFKIAHQTAPQLPPGALPGYYETRTFARAECLCLVELARSLRRLEAIARSVCPDCFVPPLEAPSISAPPVPPEVNDLSRRYWQVFRHERRPHMTVAARAAADVAALLTAPWRVTPFFVTYVDVDKFLDVIRQVPPSVLIIDTRPFEGNYDPLRQWLSSFESLPVAADIHVFLITNRFDDYDRSGIRRFWGYPAFSLSSSPPDLGILDSIQNRARSDGRPPVAVRLSFQGGWPPYGPTKFRVNRNRLVCVYPPQPGLSLPYRTHIYEKVDWQELVRVVNEVDVWSIPPKLPRLKIVSTQVAYSLEVRDDTRSVSSMGQFSRETLDLERRLRQVLWVLQKIVGWWPDKVRILHVTDKSADNSELSLKAVLEQAGGYDVTIVHDDETALTQLDQRPFDLVMVDVRTSPPEVTSLHGIVAERFRYLPFCYLLRDSDSGPTSIGDVPAIGKGVPLARMTEFFASLLAARRRGDPVLEVTTRILLIGDEETGRLVKESLPRGFLPAHFFETKDLRTADEHLARQRCELVLFALEISEERALQWLENLKKSRPKLPVIVVNRQFSDRQAFKRVLCKHCFPIFQEEISTDLVKMIKAALEGGGRLTHRAFKVFEKVQSRAAADRAKAEARDES
jgi:DNA-binding NarL/FixJ family response regulator